MFSVSDHLKIVNNPIPTILEVQVDSHFPNSGVNEDEILYQINSLLASEEELEVGLESRISARLRNYFDIDAVTVLMSLKSEFMDSDKNSDALSENLL